MHVSRKIRQYWPLTIMAVTLAVGLPFLGRNPELTGSAGGLSTDLNEFSLAASGPASADSAGFLRSSGTPPLYGFDGVPIAANGAFRSWWDARRAPTKLRELGANSVVVGQAWRDSQKFAELVTRLRASGMRIIVQVTDTSDWVEAREMASGRFQAVGRTFNISRANQVLAHARRAGVGRLADMIVLGGPNSDVMTFASHPQRQKMYRLAKQSFPGLPILMRYGTSLESAEGMHGRPHPMGGTWDEYRFGPQECDIALVQVVRGVDEATPGVKIDASLEQMNRTVSIIKLRHPEAGVVVRADFANAEMLATTRGAMWSSKDVDQFVSSILSGASVDGLLVTGLGQYTYDLGNPEFAEQRAAFRRAAPAFAPESRGEEAGRSISSQ